MNQFVQLLIVIFVQHLFKRQICNDRKGKKQVSCVKCHVDLRASLRYKREHLLFGIQQAIAVEHMNTSKHFMLNGQMMCSFVVLIDFAVFGSNTHLYNISTRTLQSVCEKWLS